MAHPLNDLTGQRFGRLTVIERGPDYVHTTLRAYGKDTTYRTARWLCRCDCGGTTTATRGNLLAGITTSCGCKRREHMSEIAKLRWRKKNAET